MPHKCSINNPLYATIKHPPLPPSYPESQVKLYSMGFYGSRLAEAACAVQSVSLANKQVTSACAELLCRGLGANRSVLQCDLHNNPIGDQGLVTTRNFLRSAAAAAAAAAGSCCCCWQLLLLLLLLSAGVAVGCIRTCARAREWVILRCI